MFSLALAWYAEAAKAGTTMEYQALDAWCMARNNWEDANRTGPFPTQPEGSFHYHHYCDAVRGLGKMYAAKDRREFVTQYDVVLDGARYVINHVAADHHLLPLAFLLMGKAQHLAKKYPVAETNLLKASQLDPRYAPIHGALANLYLDSNRKDKAKAAIQAGLEADPTSRSLRRMAAELGMKIEAPPTTQEQQKAAPATTGSESPKQEPPAAPSRASADKLDSPTSPPAAKEAAVPKAPEVKIGSPSNSWCRFCPDTPAAPPAQTPAMPGVINEGVK